MPRRDEAEHAWQGRIGATHSASRNSSRSSAGGSATNTTVCVRTVAFATAVVATLVMPHLPLVPLSHLLRQLRVLFLVGAIHHSFAISPTLRQRCACACVCACACACACVGCTQRPKQRLLTRGQSKRRRPQHAGRQFCR